MLMLYPRSGLGFKFRLQLNNTVGVIDSDYFGAKNEGHIILKLTNDSNEGRTLTVQPGDAFLVCSDGCWEPVLENEMIECLSRSENAQEWLFGLQQVIAPRLGPGSDNNTAAAIIME